MIVIDDSDSDSSTLVWGEVPFPDSQPTLQQKNNKEEGAEAPCILAIPVHLVRTMVTAAHRIQPLLRGIATAIWASNYCFIHINPFC